MNKEQFLKKLNAPLKRLSAEEREDILRDFEEHFAIGLQEGKTEEEISDSLGSPQQIGKELLATYHLEKAEATATTGNIFRALWAVAGLSFFNLVIVLGPFVALVGIIFSGWAIGVSFIAAPLLALLEAVVTPDGFEFFKLFGSIAVCGVGLLLTLGMLYATRAFGNLLLRYLQYNVKLVKGGLKYEK